MATKLLVLDTLRTLGVMLGVYVVAWFGFHWVWVVGSVIFYKFRKKTDRHEEKKKIFEEMVRNEAKLLLKYEDLPSWVSFPDIERAEWLNKCIGQMWPFLSEMVEDILREKVEPEITKHMPNIPPLKSFHFLEVDLGKHPIRLGGIQVHTQNVKKDEIFIDVEVIYAGDAVVQAGFSPVGSFGISLKEIRGTLRIELKPLLSKPPLIGAISISFVETPEIEFDLTNILNVIEIIRMDSYVKDAISKAIEAFIVLPNRYPIRIASDNDLQSLQYPMPMGVLRAKILSATDLKAMDGILGNPSDPFVKIKVGKFQDQTKVIKNTNSPMWEDEIFNIFIDQVIGTKINFEVLDQDPNDKTDVLGHTEKYLEELYHDDEAKEYVLPLHNDRGSLTSQLEWLNFFEDASDIKAHVNGDTPTLTCLFIKLEHATGLPAIKMAEGTCSPYVELMVGGKIEKSKTKRNTKNPIWNELHYFFVDNPKDEVATFKVKDESGEDLGYFEYKISKLLEQEPIMKLSGDFALQECFTDDGYVRATLELRGLVSGTCGERKDD